MIAALAELAGVAAISAGDPGGTQGRISAGRVRQRLRPTCWQGAGWGWSGWGVKQSSSLGGLGAQPCSYFKGEEEPPLASLFSRTCSWTQHQLDVPDNFTVLRQRGTDPLVQSYDQQCFHHHQMPSVCGGFIQVRRIVRSGWIQTSEHPTLTSSICALQKVPEI